MDKLPVYKLMLSDDDSEVNFISLVDEPAIEKNFEYFSSSHRYEFKDEKMEVFGAVMIPNIMIPRNDNGYEYLVTFDSETIRKASQLFFKNGYQLNTNIQHQSIPANCYVFQSFIIDKDKGIEYQDYPNGTWVVGMKCEDQDTWAKIKSGEIRGFSVEGLFNKKAIKMSVEDSVNKINSIITNMIDDDNKNDMKKINEQLKELFQKYASIFSSESKEETKMEDANYSVVDDVVYDATGQIAQDGDYEIGGKIYKQVNGKVESVSDVQPVDAQEMEDSKPVETPVNTDVEDLRKEVEALKSMVEEMAAKIGDSVDAKIEDFNKTVTSSIEQFSKTVEELNNNFKKILQVPAEFSKTNSEPKVKNVENEQMSELASMFKAIKSN